MGLFRSLRRATRALCCRYRGGEKDPFPKVVAWVPIALPRIRPDWDGNLYSTVKVRLVDSNGDVSVAFRKSPPSLFEAYVVTLGRHLGVNIPNMLLDE